MATIGALQQGLPKPPASQFVSSSTETSRGGDLLSRRAEAVERSASRSAERELSAETLEQQTAVAGARRAQAIAELAESASTRSKEIAADRWQLPMRSYRLTGRFGDVSGLWATSHTGLDFAAPDGTPIVSIARSTVVEAGWAGSYGQRVIVRREDGTEFWYAHLSRILVAEGTDLAAGELLGEVGSTGNVTGPHLHLEVRPGGGDPVDPEAALAARDIRP